MFGIQWPVDDVTIRHALKIGIAAAGILSALGLPFVKRGYIKGLWRHLYDLLLILLAVAAVAAYFEFGWLRYGRYMNPHDAYHYYMGAKYSREHNYFNLYRCSLIADKEMRGIYRQSTIRDLETHRFEGVTQVMQRKDQYKAGFSAERWEEFKKDIAYFQSLVPASKWNQMLRDKGYNATPVWNSLARWISERASTDSVWAMRLLTCIDLTLLVLMFLAVWRTFGLRVMLFSIIFYGTNYFMSFVHIKGAFMRLDWVTLLVIATCLIHAKWYKTAGALAAYAGMARIFPMIFLFGLGAKMGFNVLGVLHDRLRRREAPAAINRDYLNFFAAFAISSVIMVLLSAWYDGGFQLWRSFFEKIAVHNADISTTRAGFKYIFLWSVTDKAQYFADHQIAWRICTSIALLIAAFLMRRTDDYETIPMSFIPVFFLSAPTFYYYVMLVIPLFLFLPKAEYAARTLGVIAMFGISIAAYRIGSTMPHHFQFFFICSCMLMGLCVYMAVCVLLPMRPVAVVSESGSLASLSTLLSKLKTVRRPRIPLGFLGGLVAAFLLCGIGLAAALYFMDRLPVPFRSAAKAERTLIFAGDVMLSRNVARMAETRGGDFTHPFKAAAPYLREGDIVFCNLESPISGRGKPIDKRYTFNAPAESIAGLVYAGFNVVSLANNHILDFGEIAATDTLEILEKNNIRAIGLSADNAPQEPVIFDIRGVRIGFLAYCDPETPYACAKEFDVFEYKPARGDRETIARDIAALLPDVDLVVVSMHWGIEYVLEPDEHQVALGRFIIDQGAHIVAGHHPHVQHEPEVYKHGIILHSMGNFVFDQHSRPPTRVSRLFRMIVNQDGLVRAEYLPMEIIKDEWQPRPTSKQFVRIPLSI